MQQIDFRVKPLDELRADDFDEAPLWAAYYEPDDVDEIVRWGVPEATVRAALDATGWKDDHYFPLPAEAVHSRWGRGKLLGATVATALGTELSGYVGETRSYVVAFHDGRRFVISSDTTDEERGLSASLGEDTILPLAISNRVTGESWAYPSH